MLLDAANSEKLREEIVRLQGELEWFKSQPAIVDSAGFVQSAHPFNLGLVRSLNERNGEICDLLHSETEELERVKAILNRKDAMMQHERMVLRLKDDQIARLKSGCSTSDVESGLREEIVLLRAMQDSNPAQKESALKIFRLERMSRLSCLF